MPLIIIIFSFLLVILLASLLSIIFKFNKYKKIVNEELKFYEDKLEEEISARRGIILEYESKKHLLNNPHPEDFIKVENKDIKEDLDQRTDKIYNYLTKISNQIDYLHYHQLDIPSIEIKRSKSEILNLGEHHNYIEYILQSHSIKSEIDYFSHSLIAPEIKIVPFTFFVKRKDFNIIIDTKILQFIREFKRNTVKNNQSEAHHILTDRINKYFSYISNPKYLENIISYFTKRKVTNINEKTIIISILPTQNELSIVKNIDSIDHYEHFKLIDSGDLYQFLS